MSCSFAQELNDFELLMAADGEAETAVYQHLQVCSECQQRVEGLIRLESTLKARLYRADCPSSLALGEYQMGLLSAQEALAVAQHLAGCPACRREVSQLEHFLVQGLPAADEAVPSLRQRVRVLVARLVSSGRAVGGRLAPQPALAPALAGLRGDDPEPMVFAADGLQIILEVEPDREQAGFLSLVGLVVGLESADGAEVTLWRDGQRLAGAAVDALGNFVLPGLARGSYQLILAAPDLEVHVEELVVA